MKNLNTLKNDVKEEFVNKMRNEVVDFTTAEEIEAYFDSNFNDDAWQFADDWLPSYNHDLVNIYAGDWAELNGSYSEMCNEIGAGNTEDDNITDMIKKAIFWNIYREIYDNEEEVKQELIGELEEEETEE